jgi:hypothetical protein
MHFMSEIGGKATKRLAPSKNGAGAKVSDERFDRARPEKAFSND